MITRSRYIKFSNPLKNKKGEFYIKNSKIGVVSIAYDKGKFGVGVSFCSLEDTFDKTQGMDLSLERAIKDLENSPKTMNQMRRKVHKSSIRIELNNEEYIKDAFNRFGGIKVPESLKKKYNFLNKLEDKVATSLDDTLDSMRNALVIEKIKEDTERA